MNAKLNGQRTEMYELMVERLNGTKISEDESRTLLWIAGMERGSAQNIATILGKVYSKGCMDGIKSVADFISAVTVPSNVTKPMTKPTLAEQAEV